ncbi:hypothetical protein T06_13078 [Trichinella sp. T6]|nr:hypothetical protein T06_13078 [Trichinella sp. T6]
MKTLALMNDGKPPTPFWRTNVLSTEKLNVETEFIVYTLLLRCYPMHAYTEKRSLKMAQPHLKTSVLINYS